MEPISPSQAAQIALGVYSLQSEASIEEAAKGVQQLGMHGLFSLDGAERFEGVSGNTFLNSKSGFGYIAKGIGARSNEALIAIRGTASLADCLTDLNAALVRGPSGYLVHAGFYRTFESFKGPLEKLLRTLKPSAVHLVGHSLGGALATLTADHLKTTGLDVNLDTFGTPRAGAFQHSNHLTTKLTRENIFRVYHSADPVSMIPIYPYLHIPSTNNDIFMQSNGNIDAQAHRMDNYIRSGGTSEWKALRNQSPVGWKVKADDFVQSLSSAGGVKMLSAVSLRMILSALEAIIQGIKTGIGGAGLVFVAGATIMDRLAQLLYSGILLSAEISSHVNILIRSILTWLGRNLGQTIQTSVAFISWVLNLLFSVISNLATRAVKLPSS